MATKNVIVRDPDATQVSVAREDGILNALTRFISMFINSALSKLAIDSANRLRVVLDSSSTTAVTTVSTVSAITTQPILQQYEMMDRARASFAQGIRNNITFS